MVFLKLKHIATKYVQFYFNNTMYQQINRIGMGCPLRAAMANIFMGLQIEKLFETTNKQLYYPWYIDNTCSPLDQRADDIFI